MRLKRVELIGFKSFMDRTVLDFRDGITTILGPNGCGKSNVVDAVRWVLGEQSAKQLRGEKMEDVIFKGTRKRKPLSLAEVSLVFDNDEGRLNLPYQEVAIGRRVTRAGTSDYFLNKAPCRLKDIKDLFYDTGVGNNAYSVIEQEVVGQVLDPNENKVRTILEEGSGIVRYKVKRKEALRKLDLTQRDLLRVEDIVEEIGRQVRSLARQVGKARRHQRLFNELRTLEILRSGHRVEEIEREVQTLEARIEALRAEGTGDDAELARHRAQSERIRPTIDEREDERRTRAHELSRVEADLSRIEGELLVLREKIESGTRRSEEIAGEMERARARAGELHTERFAATEEHAAVTAALVEREATVRQREAESRDAIERHDRARAELAEAQQLSLGFLQVEAEHKSEITAAETRFTALREQQEEAEAALAAGEQRGLTLREELAEVEGRHAEATRREEELQEELREAEREVERAEGRRREAVTLREATAEELARAESRLEIATNIAREYEGYRAGAASLLKDEALRGRLKGALAEALQVREGYESAFELVFGEDADALLVEGIRDAHELAARVAAEDLGRASFLVHAEGDPSDGKEEDLPGRPALELVQADGAAHAHVARWLGRIRVVEGTAEAVEASLQHAGRGWSFLAREGLFLRHDGLVRGGAGARRQLSLFGRREQVEALGAEVERQREELTRRQAERERCEAEVDAARAAVQDRQRGLRAHQTEIGRIAEELAGRRSVLEREEQQRQEIVRRRDETARSLDELLRALEGLRQDLGRKGADQQASKARVGELEEQVAALERVREEATGRLGDARLALTHDRGVERELASRVERLGALEEDVAQRIAHLEEEGERLTADLATWRESVDTRGQELGELYEERERRQEGVREAVAAIDALRAELETAQEAMRVIHERQRQKENQLHELDTERNRQRFAQQSIAERLRERYQLELEEAREALDPAHYPRELVREEGSVSPEQVEELLAERQEKFDKLGPVNFVALEEYDEKKARLQFLEQQRDDLMKSKEDLLQAIDRINRTARKLFRETFEQVRENFREIFQTLFEGGEADLILVQTDDPLESDIQIMARPRGKRVDSVALLSGGERALTAIALLFSVYLIKPSPFCLLDEVDAPLDDINVGRFVRLLQSFCDRTQFIVITHNKLTMEAADHLYGVTMEESGVSRLVSVSFDELDAEDPLAALEEVAARRREGEEPSIPALRAGRGNGNGDGEEEEEIVLEAPPAHAAMPSKARELEGEA